MRIESRLTAFWRSPTDSIMVKLDWQHLREELKISQIKSIKRSSTDSIKKDLTEFLPKAIAFITTNLPRILPRTYTFFHPIHFPSTPLNPPNIHPNIFQVQDEHRKKARVVLRACRNIFSFFFFWQQKFFSLFSSKR